MTELESIMDLRSAAQPGRHSAAPSSIDGRLAERRYVGNATGEGGHHREASLRASTAWVLVPKRSAAHVR